jgi:hypothetical protein
MKLYVGTVEFWRETLRRTITLMLVIGLTGSLLISGLDSKREVNFLPTVHAQTEHGQQGCSIASLNGTYGFYRSGTTAVGPLGAVGIATFDGAGTSTAIQTIRKNGQTTSDLFIDPANTGPYEIEPNCAGKAFTPEGTVFAHFVVVDRGRELFIISLSQGNTVTGVMKKIGDIVER